MTDAKKKDPIIVDAEILEDGAILAMFDPPLWGRERRVIFTADALTRLAHEYGTVPPDQTTDFPGVPQVTAEAVFTEPSDAEDTGDDAGDDADDQDETEETGGDDGAEEAGDGTE